MLAIALGILLAGVIGYALILLAAFVHAVTEKVGCAVFAVLVAVGILVMLL